MALASINLRRRAQGVSDSVWEDVTATYLLIEIVCADHLQSYSKFPIVGHNEKIRYVHYVSPMLLNGHVLTAPSQ